MNKKQLLEKLEAIDAQGLNASVSVKEMIQLVNQIEIDFNPELSLELIEELSEEIADEIADEGFDIIDDYQLSMHHNEVSIDEVTLSAGSIALIVKRLLSRAPLEMRS